MTINPNTFDHYRKEQAQEIERIRALIRKLPKSVQRLVEQGETVVEQCLERQRAESDNERAYDIHRLNIFNLNEEVNGEVMKHLAMLYVAAGFHHVTIECEGFTDATGRFVKYPNALSMRSKH